jgi:hypothetical protein
MALHHRGDQAGDRAAQRRMIASRWRRAGSLALLLAVAAYFAVGSTLSLEYIDEGQILYPSWLVALGLIPYRDFTHLYGPAVFAVNGALLHWFGPDLLVVRISLVVVKTATVALTYLLARRVATRPFALAVGAVLVAVWGTPWWVFNTPYANHYSLTLTLAGLLCFLALPSRFRLGCFLAGLCFGAAATFKQTAGLFALAGFALFLILARDALERADLRSGPHLPAWIVRAARLALLAGMLGFFALYLSPRNTAWTVAMIFTPVLLTGAAAIARELRAAVDAGTQAGCWGIVWAALGAVLPIFALILYYAAHGALPDLFFNLASGLPQKFTWFEPFPLPDQRLLTALAGIALGFTAVWLVRARVRLTAASPRRVAAAAGVLGVALALLLVSAARAPVLASVRNLPWEATFLTMWNAVPVAAVWLTALVLWRSRPGVPERDETRRLGALLLYCNALTSLLLLYPSADLLHMVMGLPAYAPLYAFLGERLHRGAAIATSGAPRWGRWLSGGLIGALAVGMAAPSVRFLVTTAVGSRSDTTSVPRATAIRGLQPKFREVAALLAFLDAQLPADRELLVLNGEQMLYFLAGRRSALEKDEFALYLVGTDIISDDDARGLVDQQQAIARLAQSRPIVVEGGDRRTDDRVRRVFDELSRYIDAHYQVVATVANYRILLWAGG